MNGIPEDIIIHGVAMAPLVSVIISVLKQWTRMNSKYIPLANVLLGAIAVAAYGLVEQGLSIPATIGMVVGVVFGSQVFHETFGHAGKAIKDSFTRP